MTPRRTTIADVARAAGVSPGAVSFALNGRPGVSEATRERILRVAQELDWTPNTAARALGGARIEVVGLVLARPAETLGHEPFFAMLLAGLQSELHTHGYSLQIAVVDSVDEEIALYRRWRGAGRVDGVIVIDLRIDDARPRVLNEIQLPALILGNSTDHGDVPALGAPDDGAMLALVEHLAGLGHRRIAHVAGTASFQHTKLRVDALQDAVAQFELEWARTVPTDFTDDAGAAATRELLTASTVRPTAIIFDSDVMAVAGLSVARELGLDIPRDLSIVSFDDSVLNRLVHPEITALTRDTIDLGQRAARTLLAAIEGAVLPPHTDVPAPVLAVRASTAPPPSG